MKVIYFQIETVIIRAGVQELKIKHPERLLRSAQKTKKLTVASS